MEDRNNLFPVFLKLENLNLLIVGGGNVALEKLQAVVNNSPATKVLIVAEKFIDELKLLAAPYPNITLVEDTFKKEHLHNIHVVITALNNIETSEHILNEAHEKNLLVNVADKPALCDFYLGSIVTKGNLKLAISTNGKSPTLAKRLKETFNELLPESINDVLTNMERIRQSLKGDFKEKVDKLNELTKDWGK